MQKQNFIDAMKLVNQNPQSKLKIVNKAWQNQILINNMPLIN